ncbi:MAG: hypothetical protein ABIO45_14690 [Burkholderiaceae bacterium]
MQTYAPPTVKVRVASALLAVLATTAVLLSQLGLAMMSHDADVAEAKAAASDAPGVVAHRGARSLRRG